MSTGSQKVNQRRQTGISLVELMIYLALSSVVMVGVVQLFVANSATYNLLAGQSRMQESARFALEFVGRSIRSAGFKGCFSSNTAVYEVVDTAAVPFEFAIRKPLEGYDGQTGGSWLPDMTAVVPATNGATSTNVYVTRDGVGAGNGIPTADVITNTDILVVRMGSSESYRLSADLGTSEEPVVVQMPAAGLNFVRDQMVLAEDCEKSTLFRVTDISEGDPSGTEATVEHDLNPNDAYRNVYLKLAEVNTFQTDATIMAVNTVIYYIAPGAGINNRGNTPLSLWQKTGINAPVELVEGVEDLQLLYGVDSDGDGVPNQYRQAFLVTDWNDVVTLRVTVTVNSVDEVGATSAPTHGCTVQTCISGETYDGLVRRTFSQTIEVRNHG